LTYRASDLLHFIRPAGRFYPEYAFAYPAIKFPVWRTCLKAAYGVLCYLLSATMRAMYFPGFMLTGNLKNLLAAMTLIFLNFHVLLRTLYLNSPVNPSSVF
jgi:hypothetical protein